ncbi:AFL225Wp [Eremothecium gossypii ATCC 10895]|uniref:AFL225Wp n=1 Tax=Eremothecium gossypii (strain ATCC 10895 / CBS 109.51 / FGSC 9923 / NRRL Y-1056) TaxID=284811 RepID=Q755N8_EREGS|nr:AFL225Wp [Eremothecium gossypii ATCC 10895]AAS53149.1 AFL225Wp [Eremothecium gossypii ATCC 10895]AEY97459.1 FAFL225Wp [Eremothecium gossypii FDAG1]
MSLIKGIEREYDVILASTSPHRYSIVTEVLGFHNVAVMKPNFAEDLDKGSYRSNPVGYVEDTCKGKTTNAIQQLEAATPNRPKLVICADTVVLGADNVINEKPGNSDVQLRMLHSFCRSSAPVRVVTAVRIVRWRSSDDVTTFAFTEETTVHFDPSTPEALLNAYVASGDGLQVAGGFKIQGFPATMIRKINGDYYNVVGLPANRTMAHILRATGRDV